jgi:hypothetical protein
MKRFSLMAMPRHGQFVSHLAAYGRLKSCGRCQNFGVDEGIGVFVAFLPTCPSRCCRRRRRPSAYSLACLQLFDSSLLSPHFTPLHWEFGHQAHRNQHRSRFPHRHIFRIFHADALPPSFHVPRSSHRLTQQYFLVASTSGPSQAQLLLL